MSLTFNDLVVHGDGTLPSTSFDHLVILIILVYAWVQVNTPIVTLNVFDKHELIINLIELRSQNETSRQNQIQGPRIFHLLVNCLILRPLVQKVMVQKINGYVLSPLPLLEPSSKPEYPLNNFVPHFRISQGNTELAYLRYIDHL